MKAGLVVALLLLASPTAAFEWDDGRGALPYKHTTTRHYVSATDLEHMRRFREPRAPDFAASLAGRIRARAPSRTGASPGAATARFHVDGAGRIDNLDIVSASTPAHAQIVRSIFSGVSAPPPPGGSYNGVQSFRFR